MKIRTLIVDDEPLGRERLRTLLISESDVEIVAECADGVSAVETISREAPDLVFLDVQMPEMDGFQVLSQIDVSKPPAVIFVTAHDRFALRAFEVHAVDYLLKPFDRERFQTALQRARRLLQHAPPEEISSRLSALLAELKPQIKPIDRLAVKTEGRFLFLKPEEIDWVEAADNYVQLHVGNESHLLRETMSSLERRLGGERFLRISRSAIVNAEKIKELQPLFHGDYAVILRNGTRLTLTRGYREQVQRLVGKTI